VWKLELTEENQFIMKMNVHDPSNLEEFTVIIGTNNEFRIDNYHLRFTKEVYFQGDEEGVVKIVGEVIEDDDGDI